jgi:hypothetical protein
VRRSSIGSAWVALPGAREVYVGRQRGSPTYGACVHIRSGDAVCR